MVRFFIGEIMSYKFGDIKKFVEDNACLPSEHDIFEENEKPPMKIECRSVKFDNGEEVDARKINFSDTEVLEQTIKDLEVI